MTDNKSKEDLEEFLGDRLIQCKYEACQIKLNYKLLTEHEAECDFALIHCKYCSSNFYRKDIRNHKIICKKRLKIENELLSVIEKPDLSEYITVKDHKDKLLKLKQKFNRQIEVLQEQQESYKQELQLQFEMQIKATEKRFEEKLLDFFTKINPNTNNKLEDSTTIKLNPNINKKEASDKVNNYNSPIQVDPEENNINNEISILKQNLLPIKPNLVVSNLNIAKSLNTKISQQESNNKIDESIKNSLSKSNSKPDLSLKRSLNDIILSGLLSRNSERLLKPIQKIEISSLIYCFLYLDNLEQIIIGTSSGEILLYATNQTLIRQFSSHASIVYDIVSMTNYKTNYFITASFDNKIKVFSLNRMDPVQVIDNYSSVLCLTSLVNLDTKSFAIGDEAGFIKFYQFKDNAATITKQTELESNKSFAIYSLIYIEMEQNIHLLVSMNKIGIICVWNIDDMSIKLKLNQEHSKGDNFAIKHYKLDLFVSMGVSDNTIKIWSVNVPNSLYTFNDINSKINSISLFEGSDILLLASQDKDIIIINLETRNIIKRIETENDTWLMRTYKNGKFKIIRTVDCIYLHLS